MNQFGLAMSNDLELEQCSGYSAGAGQLGRWVGRDRPERVLYRGKWRGHEQLCLSVQELLKSTSEP